MKKYLTKVEFVKLNKIINDELDKYSLNLKLYDLKIFNYNFNEILRKLSNKEELNERERGYLYMLDEYKYFNKKKYEKK